jgi:hypothetical protein
MVAWGNPYLALPFGKVSTSVKGTEAETVNGSVQQDAEKLLHHVQVCTGDPSPAGRFGKATPTRGRTMKLAGVRARGLGIRKERSIAPLVLLAAPALAQRVVPLTLNSFKTLVTFTPYALRPEHGCGGPASCGRLGMELGRGRAIWSANLHSRIN